MFVEYVKQRIASVRRIVGTLARYVIKIQDTPLEYKGKCNVTKNHDFNSSIPWATENLNYDCPCYEKLIKTTRCAVRRKSGNMIIPMCFVWFGARDAKFSGARRVTANSHTPQICVSLVWKKSSSHMMCSTSLRREKQFFIVFCNLKLTIMKLKVAGEDLILII